MGGESVEEAQPEPRHATAPLDFQLLQQAILLALRSRDIRAGDPKKDLNRVVPGGQGLI